MKRSKVLIGGLAGLEIVPAGTVQNVMIVLHGFASSKKSGVVDLFEERFAGKGWAVVAYDLPQHGSNASKGLLSFEECLQSVFDAVEFAKKRFVGAKLNVFASSFGGFLLLNFLQKYGNCFDKVFLRAPAVNMPQTFLDHILKPCGLTLQQFEKQNIVFGYDKKMEIGLDFYSALRSYNIMNAFNIKNNFESDCTNNFVYVFQGDADDTVAPNDVKVFFEKNFENNHKLFIYKNQGHRFKTFDKDLFDILFE